MWDSTDHLVQYSAASTDCFKGRCNGDILTIMYHLIPMNYKLPYTL